ncbi:MAG TPA: hypothetical protein VHX86_13065 [Tepidisphaeraceae bacterium]|jgi:hypothetical protein|nr:hypothetical protein [Tepidisphaeraceae bacterium]
MKKFAIGVLMIACFGFPTGCAHKPKPYGEEQQLFLPGTQHQVWAIAPTINISGQSQIDPLLQSDLVYQEVQQVHGLTAIPVDRVVEVYASLKINRIQSEQQAYTVCRLLGCDGLVIPTVTAYDPYDPPKFGASLQLFEKPTALNKAVKVDPRSLEESGTLASATPPSMSVATHMTQVVDLYDASDGTVRDRVAAYAKGRTDPNGPLGPDEITVSMDRYCAFGYHELLVSMLEDLQDADAQ